MINYKKNITIDNRVGDISFHSDLNINNLDINIKKEYSINNYNKYLIIYLIKEIGNNLKEKVNYEKENNI